MRRPFTPFTPFRFGLPLLLVLLMALGTRVQASVITSTQTGNWSSGSTWVGGVAPASGDQAVINHAVTVDVNTTVGPSLCTTYQTKPTVSATGSGGSLPAGGYRVKIAAVGTGGSSTASAETSTVTITAGQVVRVTLPTLPAASSSWSVYITNTGGGSGTEHRYATGQAAGTFDCSSASWEDGTVAYASGATLPNGDAIQLNAALTINDGVKLTCKGDIVATSNITINASTSAAGIEFDAGSSPSSGAAIYHLYFGSVSTQGTETLTIRGASTARGYVQSKAATTAAQIASGQQTSTGGNVRLDCQWALFKLLGGSGYSAVSGNNTAAYNQLLTDVVFDTDCYDVNFNGVPATGGWILTRVAFKQTSGATYGGRTCSVAFQQASTAADVTSGTRTVTDCSFCTLPPALDAGGASYTGCYFHDCWSNLPTGAGGSATSKYTLTNCFVRKLLVGAGAGIDTINVVGDTTDCYLYLDNISGSTTTDLNPHGWGCTGQTGVTYTHLRTTAEYNGNDDSGDIFKDPGGGGPTINLQYALLVPNAVNKGTGTIFTFPNAGSTNYSLNVTHCTYIGGPYSLSTSEGGAQTAGMIDTFKSNLVFSIDGTTANRYAVGTSNGNASTDTQDILVPSGTDYNAGWNLGDITGNFSGAYSWYNQKLSAAPGAHDVDLGDSAGASVHTSGPKFSDPSRKFLTWCTSVLGGSGTTAQKIQKGIDTLRAIADTTDSNHVNGVTNKSPGDWVRAGFAPANASLHNTAHDGTDIGAVAYAPAVSAVQRRVPGNGRTGTRTIPIAFNPGGELCAR